MNKSIFQMTLRSIRSSFGRFAAIFAISSLGVGFLAGLLAATPDMARTGSRYFEENKLVDLRLVSNIGLDEEDIEAVSQIEGIAEIAPIKTFDLLFTNQNETTQALKVYGVPAEDPLGWFINKLTLVEGRLPENPNECLAESTISAVKKVVVGDVLTYSDQNDEDRDEDFLARELTVVGLVENPYYMAMAREQTTVGSGAIAEVIYVSEDWFDTDFYAEFMAVFDKPEDLISLSDPYDAVADPILDAVEDLADTQKHHRHDKVVGEAREKIDEAWDTYNEKKAEADEEFAKAEDKMAQAEIDIAEGKQKLIDEERKGRKEIADGEQELADALIELQDGEQEYLDGVKEYEDGLKEYQEGLADFEEGKLDFEEGVKEYEDGLKDWEEGKADYDEGVAEYEKGMRSLRRGENKLEAAQDEINAGKAQLDAGQAALDQGQAELDAGAQLAGTQLTPFLPAGTQINTAKDLIGIVDSIPGLSSMPGIADIKNGQAQIDQNQALLDQSRTELEAGQKQVNDGWNELSDGEAELKKAKRQLLDAWLLLEEGRRELEQAALDIEEGRIELADAEIELRDAEIELADGKKDLEEGRIELDDGWAEYYDGLQELEEGKLEMEEALADARADIAQGELDLEEGKKELADAKAEAEEKLNDAEMEILDAENKLKDVDDPKWYVLGRSQMLTPAGFEGNIEKVASIAEVFPVFFFMIAALVCLTTMTRMVEEERGTIGTMKALGYSPLAIASKYLIYAAIASVVGAGLGLLAGFNIFPNIIWNAYAIMYRLPTLATPFHWDYALLSAGVTVACTMGATAWVCYESMRESPAALLLPKAPKAGKRVFLEYIPFIWKRLSFNYKVTVRNLFRYKKRFFMTVFGVSGCTALLVTGFGLRDSIGDILDNQFNDLWQFDLMVGIEPLDETPLDKNLEKRITEAGDWRPIHQESAKVFIEPRSTTEVLLFVPMDHEGFTDYVKLRPRIEQTPIPFAENAAVLSEKAANNMGVGPGDVITVRNGDDEEAQVTLTGVTENYVQGYLYLAPAVYTELFGKAPAGNMLACKSGGLDAGARDVLAEHLLECPSALSVTFTQDTVEEMADSFKSIDMIIVVLIVCAGMLAFVVLYNLTNINITERQKEIATLKVLGFYEKEVADYVLRETAFLTLFGAAIGAGMGKILHGFVAVTAEVDMVMFGRVVMPQSYGLALLLTAVFAGSVSLFMNRKLRKISMVDSMKAPE